MPLLVPHCGTAVAVLITCETLERARRRSAIGRDPKSDDEIEHAALSASTEATKAFAIRCRR